MLSNFFWEGVGVGVCLAWVIYELLCFYGCHSLHSYDFVLLHVLMCMKVNNEWEKQNPVAGRHFQLEKLVQQVEQHQFLMKFSTEPKVSSCATLRHINALLPFLLILSPSTSFLLKLLRREHLYLPLLESYVRGIPSLLCQLRVSPCLIAIDPSVSILLALAGRSTWRTIILLGFVGGYVLAWNGWSCN